MATITEEAFKIFMLEQVIIWFGIPKVCVSDNGTQFKSNKFRKFLHFGILQKFSLVGHSQRNGELEVAKKIIFGGLKKRLDEAKGLWLKNSNWCCGPTERHLGRAQEKCPFG